MKIGSFYARANDAANLTKKIGLLREKTQKPQYANVPIGEIRRLEYIETWQYYIDNKLFDLRLVDGSLVQFRINRTAIQSVSYVYLESPYNEPFVTFEEFLFDISSRNPEKDEYVIAYEYDFYLSGLTTKKHITPLRYDYSPDLYASGQHPASHLHFGQHNQIRVGTKRILNPLSFILFILRQCYPNNWASFTEKREAKTICRNICEHLSLIEDKYWSEIDSWEMTLQ
jgi:hypothetical protein